MRRWHARHGRELPWRAAGDPYRVWISEIMLQQTTVAAVVPYYERFLERFPDLQTLAAADEQEVLRSWEGLGYYSRARNIHKTARRLVDEYDSRFPPDINTLQSLPGIGRYTAGAIASFAFNLPAPIVEANTQRLYCRLIGYDGEPRSATGQRVLWEFAASLVPKHRPGEFNQALMDLGATVCVPNDPACAQCPVRWCCVALREGRQREIPRLNGAVAMTAVTEASIAVRKKDAYLLRQRGETERWAGLWDFPRFEISGQEAKQLTAAQLTALSDKVLNQTGVQPGTPTHLTTIKHTVTRYRITLHCLHAEYESGRLRRSVASMRWVPPRDFDQFPLSVTGRKLAARIAAKFTDC